MTTAISINNLTKVYKGKKGLKVEALKGVCLDIMPGEVFGFLGPNGAGKSTTIKTLVGLIRATSGQATICGLPVDNPAAREHIGYLPENPALYDSLTGDEYLTFVAQSFGMQEHEIPGEVDRALTLLDLKHALKRPIRSYSKGMVQRLALAQTIVHNPDVYILDEPMSGLDPIGRALVKDLIKELKGRGKAVFFSTHITADVEVVCDRVGVIAGGELRVVDSVENILEGGIEGYYIQVSRLPEGHEVFSGCSASAKVAGVMELYVPRGSFQEFTTRIYAAGGEIDLIEPKRKDLEAFFLEIVRKSSL